jgi:hypothetical protein
VYIPGIWDTCSGKRLENPKERQELAWSARPGFGGAKVDGGPLASSSVGKATSVGVEIAATTEDGGDTVGAGVRVELVAEPADCPQAQRKTVTNANPDSLATSLARPAVGMGVFMEPPSIAPDSIASRRCGGRRIESAFPARSLKD